MNIPTSHSEESYAPLTLRNIRKMETAVFLVDTWTFRDDLVALRRHVWLEALSRKYYPLVDQNGVLYFFFDKQWYIINHFAGIWTSVPNIQELLTQSRFEREQKRAQNFCMEAIAQLIAATQLPGNSPLEDLEKVMFGLTRKVTKLRCLPLWEPENIALAEADKFWIGEQWGTGDVLGRRELKRLWQATDGTDIITLYDDDDNLYRFINGKWYIMKPMELNDIGDISEVVDINVFANL